MEQPISLTMPRDAARQLVAVLKIALKAHDNSPSPVDIKLELDELDKETLELLKDGISEQL